MTFLPIVARELRAAARRRSTYWMRAGAALLVLVAGSWVFLMAQHEVPKEIGIVLFGMLTGSAVLYCLLSGVRLTADCLSVEKREGTLGLLFLTDLKGYDVVLGKLAATSVNAIYGVLAIMPMLAIPLLMGGVGLAEFARMALVAVNTLFFSLALGLCISATSRSSHKAMAMTFLILFVLTALLPAAGAWLAVAHKVRRVEFLFLAPSVGYTFALAFDMNYTTKAAAFWWSILPIHCLGWICLGLASVIAPRSWQDRPASAQRLKWRERFQLWSYGNVVQRNAFRQGLLSKNAYFWLAARERLKPAYAWGVLGLLASCWLWGAVKFNRDWFNGGVYFVTALILNLVIKGWFATEAGRQLVEDRQQGALELILSTPLTVREILHGEAMALQRQFLGPALVVLITFLLCMVGTLHEISAPDEIAACVWLYVGAMVMLAADLIALYWVGMWFGLTKRDQNRTASASVARILILPWVGLAVVMLALSLASTRGGSDLGWRFFLFSWFGIGLAVDIGFATWARRKLLTEFRLAAAQRFEPRPGFWERLFGRGNDLPSDS